VPVPTLARPRGCHAFCGEAKKHPTIGMISSGNCKRLGYCGHWLLWEVELHPVLVWIVTTVEIGVTCARVFKELFGWCCALCRVPRCCRASVHRITTAKTAGLKGNGVLCRAQLCPPILLSRFLREQKSSHRHKWGSARARGDRGEVHSADRVSIVQIVQSALQKLKSMALATMGSCRCNAFCNGLGSGVLEQKPRQPNGRPKSVLATAVRWNNPYLGSKQKTVGSPLLMKLHFQFFS